MDGKGTPKADCQSQPQFQLLPGEPVKSDGSGFGQWILKQVLPLNCGFHIISLSETLKSREWAGNHPRPFGPGVERKATPHERLNNNLLFRESVTRSRNGRRQGNHGEITQHNHHFCLLSLCDPIEQAGFGLC
jgi:hypothetical protein